MPPKHADIVIIGAGLCGLATARLLTAGTKSIVVLEATERAGGRIRSVFD
ncbi:MAG: NAD(P)-binding protein, partial [Burkholderiaceae bacterium]